MRAHARLSVERDEGEATGNDAMSAANDPRASDRLTLRLLFVVFFLSGAAGLIYETIWSRYLGLFVGHSAYAQIIVLTIFLGGMSAGALWVGRRSARITSPLRAYAVVELAVGIIALGFHAAFLAVTNAAYDSLFPHLAGGAGVTIAKWTLAALLILPQSILLGATFPLMSAGALRLAPDQPGRVLALLYFTNSLGASIGALVTGFLLIGLVGLEGTLTTAAVLNLLVFLVVMLAAWGMSPAQREQEATPGDDRRAEGDATPETAPPSTDDDRTLTPAALWRLMLVVTFGTAIASFVYEISWIRMLALVLGSATHSFELMLSAFILGLALGAFWARTRADGFRNPLRALGIVQWVMGAAALATIPAYLASFGWTASLLGGLEQSEQGYVLFTAARYALCLTIMLPATFCAGITLPLITRTLLASGHGERSIGTVYGVNTLGSIVGVVLAGLVLLPAIGLKTLLIEGAMLDMALGVLLLRVRARTVSQLRYAWAAALALALAVAASVAFDRFDTVVLTSGVYRYGKLPEAGGRRILFYRDGRTATVSVAQSRYDKSISIATNGKPDASLDSTWTHWSPSAPREYLAHDVSTQIILPLITLAHAPGARTAAVIGQGSGISSHMLLASPTLRSLTTIEIEPEMVAGSRLFLPANRRVFQDPRARFAIEDAKSFFAGNGTQFDLILSEPSNPWVSGVSGLFTTEFYARAKRYLTPNGVFGQWLHLYEISDGLVLSVLAAVHENFPSYEVFMTSGADILIVASPSRTLPRPDWSIFQLPGVMSELTHLVPFTPRALEGTRLLSRRDLEPLLSRYAIANSDFIPVLDLEGERMRFFKRSATGFISLRAERFDALGALDDVRSPFDTATRTAAPEIPRLRALATGAVLHARTQATAEDSASGTDVVAALHRRWIFEAALASQRSPVDWRRWLTDALVVERDLHGGTAGVVDESFYRRLFTYAAAHDAPAPIRQSLHFLHGLAGWDFAEASQAADSLLPDAVAGNGWLPPDLLREGAMVSKLRLGNREGARKAWSALARQSARDPGDFRTLLLQSEMR